MNHQRSQLSIIEKIPIEESQPEVKISQLCTIEKIPIEISPTNAQKPKGWWQVYSHADTGQTGRLHRSYWCLHQTGLRPKPPSKTPQEMVQHRKPREWLAQAETNPETKIPSNGAELPLNQRRLAKEKARERESKRKALKLIEKKESQRSNHNPKTR